MGSFAAAHVDRGSGPAHGDALWRVQLPLIVAWAFEPPTPGQAGSV